MRLTAQGVRPRRKEFLIKKHSELCELHASVVKNSSETDRRDAEDAEENFAIRIFRPVSRW